MTNYNFIDCWPSECAISFHIEIPVNQIFVWIPNLPNQGWIMSHRFRCDARHGAMSPLLLCIMFILTRLYPKQMQTLLLDICVTSHHGNHGNVSFAQQGRVSLRLMTSQFKDIVTHTQKLKTVKCIFCGVWVQNFVWNFKGALWNFTQNFEPIPPQNMHFMRY